MARPAILFLVAILLNSLKGSAQLRLRPAMDTAAIKMTLKIVPQNFYNQHLSFFCKKEMQVQKLTSLTLFIRLGSKEYVDYLERKPNSFIGREQGVVK